MIESIDFLILTVKINSWKTLRSGEMGYNTKLNLLLSNALLLLEIK